MDTLTFTANPIEVEAIQFVDDESGTAIVQWILEVHPEYPMPAAVSYVDGAPYSMMVQTPAGLVHIYIGDWVVKSTGDEFIPIKEGIFDINYSPA